MSRKKMPVRNFSIIILGNSHAGKTSLILRYTENNYSTSFSSTLGIDFKLKKFTVGNICVKLQIWDTGGQERFRTITRGYYDKAMGVIFAYDCSDIASYKEVEGWMAQFNNNAKEDVVKILVATKIDKDVKEVTTKMGQDIANKYNIPFYETSAKDNINVNEVFMEITNLLLVKNLDVKKTEDERKVKEISPKKLRSDKITKAKKDNCC